MRCVNPACGQELEPGDPFCQFCGAQQTQDASSEPSAAGAPPRNAGPESTTAQPASPATPPERISKSEVELASTGDTLIMRAGAQIWDFTESEGEVAPGKRRPTIIMDEESTHLAHTDRLLSMTDLHQRVSKAIETYAVPVDVKLVKARWINDAKESRQRIVASLRDHVFQDIKVIFGLDYLGRWANIHVSIGMEPTPLESEKAFAMPDYVKFTLIGGAVAVVLGLVLHQTVITVAGVAAGAFGIWRYLEEKKKHTLDTAAEKAKSAAKRAAERMTRTYKIDDMRLFCTAMKSVYQAVVDDIVQSGANVVRVEGGRGGYFSGSDNQTRAPSARLSDAADAEV